MARYSILSLKGNTQLDNTGIVTLVNGKERFHHAFMLARSSLILSNVNSSSLIVLISEKIAP